MTISTDTTYTVYAIGQDGLRVRAPQSGELVEPLTDTRRDAVEGMVSGFADWYCTTVVATDDGEWFDVAQIDEDGNCRWTPIAPPAWSAY